MLEEAANHEGVGFWVEGVELGGDVGLIMQCLCLNQVTKMKCLQHVTTLQQPRGTVCMCFCDWLTRNDKKMLENLGVCCYI